MRMRAVSPVFWVALLLTVVPAAEAQTTRYDGMCEASGAVTLDET